MYINALYISHISTFVGNNMILTEFITAVKMTSSPSLHLYLACIHQPLTFGIIVWYCWTFELSIWINVMIKEIFCPFLKWTIYKCLWSFSHTSNTLRSTSIRYRFGTFVSDRHPIDVDSRTMIIVVTSYMRNSFWWQPWPSPATLKGSFNVPSDDQGSHPIHVVVKESYFTFISMEKLLSKEVTENKSSSIW